MEGEKKRKRGRPKIDKRKIGGKRKVDKRISKVMEELKKYEEIIVCLVERYGNEWARFRDILIERYGFKCRAYQISQSHQKVSKERIRQIIEEKNKVPTVITQATDIMKDFELELLLIKAQKPLSEEVSDHAHAMVRVGKAIMDARQRIARESGKSDWDMKLDRALKECTELVADIFKKYVPEKNAKGEQKKWVENITAIFERNRLKK